MINRVLIVAGDPSGDLHGAGVVDELRRRLPDIDLYGIGGDRMKNAGMELIYNANDLSFMGFAEVVKHLPFIRQVEKSLEGYLVSRRPDIVLLIDYPGFNLRFARRVKNHGIPAVYYISPQVWAWGKRRLKKMKHVIDKMLVVFPFEKELYENERIPAEFVGHPLLDVMRVRLTRAEFFLEQRFDNGDKLLGLFPGSRTQEIERMLPVMLDAVQLIREHHNIQVAVSKAPNLPAECYRNFLRRLPDARLVEDKTYELMKYSDAAIVTSGTATLETACFETPMVVVYKASRISYFIGRLLVSVKSIGLVNIVAGKRIVPELIQHEANAEAIAFNINQFFDKPLLAAEIKSELAKVKGKLGVPGAAGRVAETLINFQLNRG
ncbi:MAG: lipid-A-disaccharide synthase [Bacteroidota bacterium]